MKNNEKRQLLSFLMKQAEINKFSDSCWKKANISEIFK